MPPSPDEIREHVQKLVSSATFGQAERMRRFLRYVVEHSLSSPNVPLKEIVIGMELYASGGEFDPRQSATVRVDATRLRAKLREYYSSEGASDRLRIGLPKGGYVPLFFDASQGPAENPGTVVEAAESSDEPSIVVLPFSNLSPEPEDYFSDGLTDEITHALSSVAGLRVVARTSAFAFRHRNADVRHVGQALNVGFVLEGSVRKSGDALRVTVQLVSTADGFQRWSRRYERTVGDVFAVQDEIAREIVDLLCASTGKQRRVPAANMTGNFEAYSCYLQGRHHLNRQTRGSLQLAIDCFEEALRLSPRYAPAQSGAAVAWLYQGVFANKPPRDAMPRAREAAASALEIDPQNGDALSVAACTKAMFEYDWAGAESLFRKALRAENRSDLTAHMFAMFSLLPMARIEEGLAVLEEARPLDPLSLFVSASRGAILLMAGRTTEAEAEYRRALELDQNFWRAMIGLGRCHEMNGRLREAIACFEQAKIVSDSVPTAIGALGHAYGLAGQSGAARDLMVELCSLAQSRYVSPYGRVLISLGLGEQEEVFTWLETSYQERAGWLMYLGLDPRFDRLRGDSRMVSLLRRMGLAQSAGSPLKPFQTGNRS